MSKKKPKQNSSTIALNKKAKHDYFIEERYEAGVSLMGWEVKSLREGKVNLTDCFIHMRNGEAWLVGCNINPLPTVSTHFVAEPMRSRKLLLNRRELDRIDAAIKQKGYTCVCTALYWKQHLVKCEIALAKGKAKHDKRQDEKNRDWERQKQRIMRHSA